MDYSLPLWGKGSAPTSYITPLSSCPVLLFALFDSALAPLELECAVEALTLALEDVPGDVRLGLFMYGPGASGEGVDITAFDLTPRYVCVSVCVRVYLS